MPAKKTPAKRPAGKAVAPGAAHGDSDPFVVRALARGLSILQLFDVDHREWSIDEMAEKTDLLRMTVYRMVRTLESLAFLVRDPATNRYRLGPATLAMIYVSEDHSGLLTIAHPYLESLVEQTGESVTLAIEVDGIPVCIDMINSSRPFKRETAPGRIIGDLASVQGKLFSAFKSPAERDAIAASQPRLGSGEVLEPEALEAEFERIRREDVSYDIEGLYSNLCAVGCPIRDQVGNVIAAVAVVVPSGRFGEEERTLCTQAVRSTADSLSAYLGWNRTSAAPQN